MDRQQIGLKLALDSLGRELSLDDFDSRLALQKMIYLVQAAGVHLGYTYGWYLRGPYSRELTRDAFSVRAELMQSADGWNEWKLDPVSENRLAGLRQMFEAIPDKSQSRWLELLASVHFLLETRQGNAGNIPGLRQVLLSNRKDFSEEEISRAIEELKKHALFPTPR
jgi:uncharacterized protein YwgA